MALIDVSEIVNDPDFAQVFSIKRDLGGTWVLGGYLPNFQLIVSYGAIQPANEKDLDQVPEGDRVKGAIKVWSTQPLFVTRNVPTQGGSGSAGAGQGGFGQGGNSVQIPAVSDIVVWPQDQQDYRLAAILPWSGNGYYRAIGVRMLGE